MRIGRRDKKSDTTLMYLGPHPWDEMRQSQLRAIRAQERFEVVKIVGSTPTPLARFTDRGRAERHMVYLRESASDGASFKVRVLGRIAAADTLQR